MMIDLGETQVFKGHVAHARDGGIDIDRAVTNLLEQGTELILVHQSRVSKRRLSPLQFGIMTVNLAKVPARLGLFCAFRSEPARTRNGADPGPSIQSIKTALITLAIRNNDCESRKSTSTFRAILCLPI